MMMEMLALLMRCLLNTLTLCHSLQKGRVILDMRVVILRRRVSIGHFVRGSVDIFEGCSENYIYLFLFSIFDTFILVHGSIDHFWHTLYLSSLYVNVCFFHLPLHLFFLFFLYAHASYYMYAIYYFCFTQRCLDEFCLKCFRNIGCQKSTCHKLSSYKVFQEFVLG